MITSSRVEMVVNRVPGIRYIAVKVQGSEDLYEVSLAGRHRPPLPVYRAVFTEDENGRVVFGPRECYLMAQDLRSHVIYFIQNMVGHTLGMGAMWREHLGPDWHVWESEDLLVRNSSEPLPMMYSEKELNNVQ